MYLVPVGQLEPGQVVARAVVNASGAVLCPPGLALTQTTIDRLTSAGVENVAIEGSDVSVERIQGRIQALEVRFTGVNAPLALELKRAIESQLQSMLPDTIAENGQ